MEDIYFLLGLISGWFLYQLAKKLFLGAKRRWGENPSDATYGGKR